jgi:hypothetical protein
MRPRISLFKGWLEAPITAIRAGRRDALTPTRVHMDEYESHPFADAFPMMTDREHAALVAS